MDTALIRVLWLLAPLGLAACGADNVWAPDDAVSRAAYVAAEPPSLTLYTVIRNSSGEGAHSGLMVTGSQRVMFDPAGTWWHSLAPERHDLHYGMTPTMLRFYIDYHARETYHVVEQKIYVSPEVAERALVAVQTRGPVPKSFCASSVSGILQDLPGFGTVPQTLFPTRIMKAVAQLPNVETRTFYDTDADNHTPLLISQNGSPGIVRDLPQAPPPGLAIGPDGAQPTR